MLFGSLVSRPIPHTVRLVTLIATRPTAIAATAAHVLQLRQGDGELLGAELDELLVIGLAVRPGASDAGADLP
jgi:hypothetical protein